MQKINISIKKIYYQGITFIIALFLVLSIYVTKLNNILCNSRIENLLQLDMKKKGSVHAHC